MFLPNWYRFNPTLVRLRPRQNAHPANRLDQFQSHAGSIEARSPARRAGAMPSVSIPRWFD